MNSFMQKGFAAVKAGDPVEAIEWFEQALRETPGNAEARAWLGQALCSIGKRLDGAVHLLEAGRAFLCKARETKNIGYVIEIVTQLQHWGDYSHALQLLREVVEIAPEEFRCYQLLAATYAQLNKKMEALTAAEKAASLAPDNLMMQVFLASLEADAGKNTEARERLDRILAGRPNTREAFRAHKELARVLDKLGEYESVFQHLHASGKQSPLLPEYAGQDAKSIPETIRLSQSEFDRNLMGRWANTRFPADLPAPNFVLGFMRSGTTLTHEVLDAHPEVFVADEVPLISSMKDELSAIERTAGSTADKLRRLDLKGVLHLRRHYWQCARDRFGQDFESKTFVDKLTMNTIDLGLINFIFPDAKVIFVMRDPRDVCLSCFMQLMVPTPTTVQTLTWEGTARFYAQTMNWWAYVRDQLTLDFLELRYEDVVADFESAFRRAFGFLNVAWDPGVMDFHEHAARKHVATPSRIQVTQPLYASSVGRWRKYAPEFASVAGVLNPFVDKFGYRP